MSKVWRFEVISLNTLSGETQISSVHYQTDLSSLADEPSAAQVLDKVLDHFSSSGHNLSKWRDAAYGECTFTECRVREEVAWWDHEIGDQAVESLTLTGNLGAAGSTVTPDGLAPWIQLKSAAASRSGRGGVHGPGPFSALTLGPSGLWNTGGTLFSKLDTLGAAIVDELEGVFGTGATNVDLNPVIYSMTRRRRGDTPFTFQLVAHTVSPEPRWIRRRMR